MDFRWTLSINTKSKKAFIKTFILRLEPLFVLYKPKMSRSSSLSRRRLKADVDWNERSKISNHWDTTLGCSTLSSWPRWEFCVDLHAKQFEVNAYAQLWCRQQLLTINRSSQPIHRLHLVVFERSVTTDLDCISLLKRMKQLVKWVNVQAVFRWELWLPDLWLDVTSSNRPPLFETMASAEASWSGRNPGLECLCPGFWRTATEDFARLPVLCDQVNRCWLRFDHQRTETYLWCRALEFGLKWLSNNQNQSRWIVQVKPLTNQDGGYDEHVGKAKVVHFSASWGHEWNVLSFYSK